MAHISAGRGWFIFTGFDCWPFLTVVEWMGTCSYVRGMVGDQNFLPPLVDCKISQITKSCKFLFFYYSFLEAWKPFIFLKFKVFILLQKHCLYQSHMLHAYPRTAHGSGHACKSMWSTFLLTLKITCNGNLFMER